MYLKNTTNTTKEQFFFCRQQGCWNSAQLYEEIKKRGYTGSGPLLRRFIVHLRKKQQAVGNAATLTLDPSGTTVNLPAKLPPQPQCTHRMSPTRASWLYVSQPAKLDEKQRQHVEDIRKGHPDLEAAYQLSQAFVSMLAERRDAYLDS